MKKHHEYDLWMHDDLELSDLLTSRLKNRETIHEWPNSGVQKIVLENDSTYIYKYQF